MNSKKRLNVVVVPYDNGMRPYLRHNSMIKNTNIQILLSPNGWAIGQESICGYMVQTALSETDYQGIDAVWITESSNKIQDEQLYGIIENMLKYNKQILLARTVQETVYNKISELVKDYSGNMIDLMKADEISDIDISPMALYDIYTPIIWVAGVGEQTDKFLVQLSAKRYLEEKGYHVVLVSSRKNSVFLNNTYTFPCFMDANIPSEQKIILYNHFIKKIEQEEKPEVIILGVPEGIMPISKFQAGYFGICAFEILNAVNRSIPIEYFSRKQSDIEDLRIKLESDTDKQEKIFTESSVEIMGQYIIDCLNDNAEMETLKFGG